MDKILNKKNKKSVVKSETIFEEEFRLKQEAKLIVKNHIDKKPIKYLLKN